MEKLVNVRFGESNPSEYTYRTCEELEAGQTVIVETRHGLSVATVTAMTDELPVHLQWEDVKEVAAKADLTAYNLRKERAERRQALRIQMEKRAKELQELESFKVLAHNDEKMQEMVDEYDTLS